MKQLREAGSVGKDKQYSVVDTVETVSYTGSKAFYQNKLAELQASKQQHLDSAQQSRDRLEAMIASNIAVVDQEIAEVQDYIRQIEDKEKVK